jgi:NitT/TauT family transport system permease protein
MIRATVTRHDPMPLVDDLGGDPLVGAPPASAYRRSDTYVPIALAVAIFVALMGSWFYLSETETVSNLLLPKPVEVWESLSNLVSTGLLWTHLWATAQATLLGFVIAVVAAVAVGSVFAMSRTIRLAVYPYILASQTFPKVAIAPLIVAALGYGLMPKVVLAALLAFFPVLVNTIAGLTEVSDAEENLLRVLRANRWQELRYLRLPNALAFIFPALSSAAILALIGAIVGEFVSGRVGIGYAINQYTITGEVSATYAMLLVLALFGLTIYGLLHLLERLVRPVR